MPILYATLGSDRQLNEIVMAGSHDAGITRGASNVRTQDQDIGGQAAVGVRVFDLRIAAAASTQPQHGLGKEAELRAFHADGLLKKNETKQRFIADLGRHETIERTKLRGGAFGLGLTGMLEDAKRFVEQNASEFLILKFDKCSNWALIAESCIRYLGNTLYTGTGNLNTKTLRELAGKVIPLFTADGLAAVQAQYPLGSGILGIRNLSGGDVYNPKYDGLQYFGKGGTSVVKPFGKFGQNLGKQTNLMQRGGAECDPDVMGMMYWTSTGMLESIRSRNNEMWRGTNVASLNRMWKNGLSEAIESRITASVDPASHASGAVLKAFMPNIVMIDFADEGKCRHIYNLNHVAATALTDAVRAVDREVEQVRKAYAQLQQNMGRRLT